MSMDASGSRGSPPKKSGHDDIIVGIVAGIILGLPVYFIGRISTAAAITVTILGGLLCLVALADSADKSSPNRLSWRASITCVTVVAVAMGAAWNSLQSRTPNTSRVPAASIGSSSQSVPAASPPTSTSPAALVVGRVYSINNDDCIGCSDRALYDQLIRYAKADDIVAFLVALNRGVADGICTYFEKGERVELVQIDSWAMPKLIKVRRVGARTEYWTLEGTLR